MKITPRKIFFSMFCTIVFCSHSSANTDEPTVCDVHEVKKIEDAECIEKEILGSKQAQASYGKIQEVLDREEFGETEYRKAWRKIDLSDKQNRDDKIPEWLIKFIEWFESDEPSSKSGNKVNFSLLFNIVEVLFWALAIGLIVYVLVKYHQQIRGLSSLFTSKKQVSQSLPSTMFGLDIKEESLPDDIIVSAKKHWSNGEARAAIALLLRASLIKLLNEHDCRFYDSDTEAECCFRIDKQAPKPLSQFMRSLVSVWQQIAYAHRIPSQDIFDSLCAQWQETF